MGPAAVDRENMMSWGWGGTQTEQKWMQGSNRGGGVWRGAEEEEEEACSDGCQGGEH